MLDKKKKTTTVNVKNKIPPMKTNNLKEFPDKLFVVKSDKKKPYDRLDKKF